jgi:acetylornithine/succinyldiaminopimelate/putrescine aminotransferase
VKPLVADQLREDPRVIQAHELLQEALEEHRGQLCAVQEPDRKRGKEYRKRLERLGELRGVSPALPYIGSGIGNGCFVELADGSVKLDFIGGIGQVPAHGLNWGQPLSDVVMQGNLQQNREAVELMERLTEASGLHHCFFSTAGTLACENGLKIAFQKNFPRSRVLAFSNCFMGRSLGAAQVTDKAALRQGLPETLSVDYIPFGSMEGLEELLARYPDQHAVMVMELVQGEGGINVGNKEYFAALTKRLREAGILIMVDEVQTFGRTESLFASEHFGVEPDIVTIGKLSQVCATLFTKEVAPRPGLLSHTFISSSSAIQASLALLQVLQNGDYYGRLGSNARLHRRFVDQVAGAYGLGMMFAFVPGDGSREVAEKVVKRLFENGLITFMAGHGPYCVRCLPPLLGVDEETIDMAAEIIKRTLQECM